MQDLQANQPATMQQPAEPQGDQPAQPDAAVDAAADGSVADGEASLQATVQEPEQTVPLSKTPMLPGLLIFGGMLIFTITVLNATRRKRAQQIAQQPEKPSHRLESLRAAATADAGIEGRVARAAGIVRDATSRLEIRAARLEILLEHADERIANLERALDQQPAAPRVAAPQQPKRSQPAPDDTAADPVRAQVFSLADEGLSPIEIAKRTDQHVGKVELMLALRRA